jgi:NTE family protein
MSSNGTINYRNVEKYVDLVLEGGGVKGIALVGALSILEEQGFLPQNLAGTSAGAIVATLYAAGYKAVELRDIIGSLKFDTFMDSGWEDRIPLVGTPLSVLKDQGIYEGEYFLKLMGELLEAKGVRTFRDLVHPAYADQPRYRYRVRIIASDITERQLLMLPQDAAKFGIHPDDFNVALALRMSMSIPIFFEPIEFRNAQTGREHLIVDGGILSNYPIWLFDSQGTPEWPTFGLRLVEPNPATPLADRLPAPHHPRGGIQAVVDYMKSLAQTTMELHDRLYIEKADFARTIPISTLGVSSTDFHLSRERKTELYKSGRMAAQCFLKTWDFDGYIAAFRGGIKHHRTEDIAWAIAAAPRKIEASRIDKDINPDIPQPFVTHSI